MKVRRGDIIIVNLNPVRGSEQGGIRPCLVVQNNVGNEFSPLTIIAPITSKISSKKYPTNVFLPRESSKLKLDSIILLSHISTVDKSRIRKRISHLDHSIMRKVDIALEISLGLT